jgi:hypothetical protein
VLPKTEWLRKAADLERDLKTEVKFTKTMMKNDIISTKFEVSNVLVGSL